jgi:LmbE family N-acetylglucosaminyl deacetylase
MTRVHRALAVAAHPDDIEFMMAGTLLLLRERGWETHYLNLSTGNLGSLAMPSAAIARTRRAEARAAAEILGAVWHAPMCNDMEVFYDDRTIRRVCAVVREVDPDVVFTHSPQDYMEDHTNTARLAVSAAFVRGMPNYRTSPARKRATREVTIYHASPHGLRDSLRRRVHPGAFVDTTSVHEIKRTALACHVSQGTFLDATQGMQNYIRTMEDFSIDLGKMSRKFRYAEGWRRHLHLGYCSETADPLRDALGSKYLVNVRYEREL